jgi:hypothetical protein
VIVLWSGGSRGYDCCCDRLLPNTDLSISDVSMLKVESRAGCLGIGLRVCIYFHAVCGTPLFIETLGTALESKAELLSVCICWLLALLLPVTSCRHFYPLKCCRRCATELIVADLVSCGSHHFNRGSRIATILGDYAAALG